MRAWVLLRRGGAVAIVVIAVLTGCAHRGARSPNRVSVTETSASTITRREVDSLLTKYPTAYDLIRYIRPNMLVSRDIRLPNPTSDGLRSDPSGVKVFIDDVYVGGTDVLLRLPSRMIMSVQHLSPSNATTRYGSGMVAGVIAITTSGVR